MRAATLGMVMVEAALRRGQGIARQGRDQPSAQGETWSMNSSRRSFVDLPRMASAEITTAAPPKPSGLMREHVKDDTTDTYLSVDDRRTIS